MDLSSLAADSNQLLLSLPASVTPSVGYILSLLICLSNFWQLRRSTWYTFFLIIFISFIYHRKLFNLLTLHCGNFNERRRVLFAHQTLPSSVFKPPSPKFKISLFALPQLQMCFNANSIEENSILNIFQIYIPRRLINLCLELFVLII